MYGNSSVRVNTVREPLHVNNDAQMYVNGGGLFNDMDLVLQKMISIDTREVKLKLTRPSVECIRNRADFEPAFGGS